MPFSLRKETNKSHSHILFVLTAAFSQRGGIEKFNQQLLQSWIETFPDDEITIVVEIDSLKDLSHLSSPKVSVVGCQSPFSILSKIKMGFALLRAIFMKRPNHVIVGHVSWSFFVWAFSKICRYRYSLIIHGIEVFNHNVFREKGLIGARFLWSISSYTQEMVAHKDGYPKEKIILFPPLADEKSFTVPANKRVMREKVGVTHQKLMLTVARLEERERFKGVDVVFQALRQLKRNDFFYIIVGSGNDLIRMQELAKSLGLSGNVKFVGSQDDESLLQFFQAADIYVMPSYEGFGIVYLEALLCGVPVISGNRDGSSEPLQGGKLGFQVDRNIPAEVVRAILEIEKGEDRRCQPEWLRNETIRVFGWEKYIERVKMIRKMSLED